MIVNCLVYSWIRLQVFFLILFAWMLIIWDEFINYFLCFIISYNVTDYIKIYDQSLLIGIYDHKINHKAFHLFIYVRLDYLTWKWHFKSWHFKSMRKISWCRFWIQLFNRINLWMPYLLYTYTLSTLFLLEFLISQK